MESESVYDGLFQIVHSEGSQFSPTCLRIPHILRQILENCSNSELLPLSLVNKQWNYEARSVIKDRGTVIARLDRQQPCEDLAAFASHVRQMIIVPYSGISIHFDHDEEEDDHELLRWTEALELSLDVIRNQLLVKHLSVSFHQYWERYEDCPPFLWVQEILQDHCWVLESVNVHVASDFEEFNRQNVRHFNFPRLKKLKVSVSVCYSCRMRRAKITFIKAMVSRAPNLQELALDNPARSEDYRALLEGSSAVLVLNGEIDPMDREIRGGVISDVRLSRVRLDYSCGDFSMERFNSIVPVVLQTSCSTLEELSLNLVLVPSLMRYGIRLKNVKRLQMCMDGQWELDDQEHVPADVSAFLRVLQDLDFTHIFPKLTEVEVSSSEPYRLVSRPEISQFVNQGNVIPEEPKPDRAVNVKHLKYLNHNKRSSMNVSFLASVFPDIEALSIENCCTAPPFGLICEHWVRLRQLVVHNQGVWGQNWDSVLSGLFPEEIAQLREEDEEYLKAVNIVPVMPSITSMKELRTFTVSNNEIIFHHEENDPTYVFSKVTGLIALSRCPNLSVTLQVTSYWENAFSHVRNYADIVLVDGPKLSAAKRPRPQ